MKGKIDEFTSEELDKSLFDSKEELRKERFKAVTSKVENPRRIRELKKHIARVLTLKRQRELGMNKGNMK